MRIRIPFYELLLLFVVILFFSCDSLDIFENQEQVIVEDESGYVNDIESKDNDLIKSKSVFGNDDEFSEYILVEKSAKGGFYVAGALNSGSSTSINVGRDNRTIDYFDPSLMKYDSRGVEEWNLSARPGFLVHQIKVIPSGILDNDEYILLSGYDDNEADVNDPDRTRLMLLNSQGKKVSQFDRDFFIDIWDFAISKNQAGWVHFMSVGTVNKSDIDGNFYPVVFEFAINKSNKEIVTIFSKQLWDVDNDRRRDDLYRHVRFKDIEVYGNNFIVSAEHKENNQLSREIHLYRFNSPDFSSFHKKWIFKNAGNGIVHQPDGLIVHNNNAILTGYVSDASKDIDGKGFYLNSPYIISQNLNTDDTDFFNIYSITNNSDRLFYSDITDNTIISVGVSSYWWCSNCEEEYTVGNGLILTADVNTGNRRKAITFGSKTYRSILNGFMIEGNNFWGIGAEQTTNSTSKALIIKVDKADLF